MHALCQRVSIYGPEIWRYMFNSRTVKWDSSDTKNIRLQFCEHILAVNTY